MRVLLLILSGLFAGQLVAGGGMWLPLLLQNLNEEEMRSLGMEITAEDIYSINEGSLKDAIVHFGGFCTGEVISDRGLVLTNHHCGFGAIQDHSTLTDNYLQDGFWAMEDGEELPNPGLFVTFIERIEDVSRQVLDGVDGEASEAERMRLVQSNSARLKSSYELQSFEELLLKPFYEGNKYYAFVTRTYRDIRLVGAPPSSIGKFGADTDNWEWPRHTGDFSLFRIYTAPDGRPATYAPENVPLVPRRHLEISTAGVEPGDFSMIFGFPGTTDQYLPALAMEQRTGVINPIRVGMRDRSLAVIDSAMRADPQVRIDYASKQARIANAWKKWRGESQGVAAVGGVAGREELEREFLQRVAAKPSARQRYGDVLTDLESLYSERLPLDKARAYVSEINYNIDLFRTANYLAARLKVYQNNGTEEFAAELPRIRQYVSGVLSGYHAGVDREVARALLTSYFEALPLERQSAKVRQVLATAANYDDLIDGLYSQSLLTDSSRLAEVMAGNVDTLAAMLDRDPGLRFVRAINAHYESTTSEVYNQYTARINALQRTYMEGLLRFFPERALYPDANGTLRVSYGQFEGFTGLEGTEYDYQTYLEGVMAKYVPGDYEFDVPQRLRDLYATRDYGAYASAEGKLPVCVLGSNHTTGGNSGSPALNGKGQLVGLNFDRSWQSTMSDIYYDPSICRNIMVDIRYVLFLIDKFAGAGHLVEEMSVVR